MNIFIILFEYFSQIKFNLKQRIRRIAETQKRPQGVHREVWGLICKDGGSGDLSSGESPLMPSSIEEPSASGTKYRHQGGLYAHHPRARLHRGVRKWHWTAFENAARADHAQFWHWRCANDDPAREYPFAKYNKHIHIIRYTEPEYSAYLHDEHWTRAETDQLIDLCEAYDLRFFVVHDRWPAQFKLRSIDELKDRYYKVIAVMQRLRTGAVTVDEHQAYTFDMEHEQKRREQLEKLFSRSKEQIDEELYLIEELKKIEIRKREREKKQQDVSKLLTAVRDLDSNNNLAAQQQLQFLKNTQRANENNNNGKRIKNRRPLSNDQSLNRSLSGGANKSNTPLLVTQQHGNNSNNTSLNNSTENLNISPNTSLLVGSGGGSSSKRQQPPHTLRTSVSGESSAVVAAAGIKFPEANKVAGVSLRSFRVTFSFLAMSFSFPLY